MRKDEAPRRETRPPVGSSINESVFLSSPRSYSRSVGSARFRSESSSSLSLCPFAASASAAPRTGQGRRCPVSSSKRLKSRVVFVPSIPLFLQTCCSSLLSLASVVVVLVRGGEGFSGARKFSLQSTKSTSPTASRPRSDCAVLQPLGIERTGRKGAVSRFLRCPAARAGSPRRLFAGKGSGGMCGSRCF